MAWLFKMLPEQLPKAGAHSPHSRIVVYRLAFALSTPKPVWRLEWPATGPCWFFQRIGVQTSIRKQRMN